MKMKIVLLTSAVVMFAATQASAALILINGGFEDPVFTDVGDEILVGNTNGSWTAVGTNMFTTGNFGGVTGALEGDQFNQVVTGAGPTGRMFQLLGTTDLVSDITLEANFIQRNLGNDAGYSFGLYSDEEGTVALAETLDQPAGARDSDVWVNDSVTAIGVASGVSVYAFFTAAIPPSSTNFLFVDDVKLSVTEIPEPSSMLLVGLGVLGLGVVRRRRQR